MTRIAFVLACLIGVILTTPDAAAQTTPAQVSAEEAPAEDYISTDQDCRRQRRSGRLAFVRHCATNETMAISSGAGACASRVAYRGHRRVLLPVRHCRPLFSSRPLDA
jgi:hypothetical protein